MSIKENLNDWLAKNIPDDDLIYKKGLYDQCNFVRNILMWNLFVSIATDYLNLESFDERNDIHHKFIPSVIGMHISKSVKLPVMEIDLSKFGLKIILRYNFYDWCISVESKREIKCDFCGLDTYQKGYFEGFPKNRIYNNYSSSNNKKFSIVLEDNYQVYTFIFLLRNWLIETYKVK